MSQFLRTVRTSQPQGPAQIDWSNPLSPKSGLWVPNRNLVTGKPVSFGGSGNAPKTVVGPNGTELSTDGQYIQTDIPAAAFSVLTWCIVLNPAAAPSGANNSSLFQSGQATVDWSHPNSSYRGSFTLHNGGSYPTCQFVKGFVAGVRVILHGTYDGATLRVYRNGVLENSVSTANSTSGTALSALQLLGGAGAPAPFSGSASYMSWDTTRALSAAQIKQHADNVWQVLIPQSRSLWIPGAVAAGGGVSGNLNATESSADTFAGSGQIIVQGTLAATEAGSDTAAIAAQLIVTGSISATESGVDTATLTGQVVVTGALSASETGADTALINGSSIVITTGAVSAVESGSDGCVATGNVLITGLLAAAESGGDTAYAPGQIYVIGVLAATEAGADTCEIRQSIAVGIPAGHLTFEPSIAAYSFEPSVAVYSFLPSGNTYSFEAIQ